MVSFFEADHQLFRATKTVRESDLKPPLISTRCKKPRLLNTIGVSRGFGDHHLMTADDRIPIKPFLCPFPEVKPKSCSLNKFSRFKFSMRKNWNR